MVSVRNAVFGFAVLFLSYYPFLSSALDGGFYMSGNYDADFASTNVLSADESLTTGASLPADASPRFVFKDRKDEGYSSEFKMGHLGGLKFGYYFLENPRIEVEGLYSVVKPQEKSVDNKNDPEFIYLRDNPVTTSTPYISYKQDGVKNSSVMVNVYYDFVSPDFPVHPYLAVGVGISRMEFLGKNINTGSYQLKAGASIPLTKTIRAYAGYRYFSNLEGDGFPEITGSIVGTNPAVAFGKITAKVPYHSSGFEVGFLASL